MKAIHCFAFITLFIHHYNCENLRFASYYGDHMVLQKFPERAVLWGYGPDGTQVTVSVSGPITQTSQSVTVTNGTWQVTIDPVEAGGPYNVTASLTNFTVTLTDVLFGDIWLCGGQSNMCFEMYKVFNASQELDLVSQYPHVRVFTAGENLSEQEMIDLAKVDLPWSVPTATNVAQFSALCWMFGRHMYANLKHPIGLVESCWGRTLVEAWSSSRALQQCGLDGVDHRRTQQNTAARLVFNQPKYIQYPKDENSVLWNAMIHPFLKMTLKGAIWYQGESNAYHNMDKYNCSFPAMIDDWRLSFHQGSGGQTALNFPFGFVQLATGLASTPGIENMAQIRWHQTADTGFAPNQRMNKTFMAVAMDLPDDASPYQPQAGCGVLYRLSLGARAVAYGEKGVQFLGPFPKEMISTGAYLNITYDQAVSVAQSDDIFEICCSDVECIWKPAPVIQWTPTSVQVSTSGCLPSDKVAALRYAWKDQPCDFEACAIYSTNHVLPAPPFKFNL